MFYRLSPQLVLRSPWRPYRPRPGERVLVVRTPGAFPPGHPTTRLSLELLPEALGAPPGSAGFQPVIGKRLLDVGCGSGVLTLAGAALGAGFCLGVDLLRPAVRRARENARANGLAAAVQLVQGSTECLRGPFDVLVANLPWPVQLAKVPELDRLAAGTLILSGFRDLQEAELLARYRERGWSLNHRLSWDEWAIEMPPDRSYTWVAWLLQRPEKQSDSCYKGMATDTGVIKLGVS